MKSIFRELIQVKLQLRIDPQEEKKALGADGVASDSRKCENRWRELLLRHDESCERLKVLLFHTKADKRRLEHKSFGVLVGSRCHSSPFRLFPEL